MRGSGGQRARRLRFGYSAGLLNPENLDMWLAKRMLVLVGVVAGLLLIACAVLTQPLVQPASSRTPSIDVEKLRSHVRMLSEQLYPRSFDQRQTLDAAASYVHAQLATTGAVVEDQVFTVSGETYRNVIARFGPQDGPVVVVGAHYDSDGDQARGASFPLGYDLSTHTPGADDNASGVAGLLELARLLSLEPPRVGVELVAFTLEEEPNFQTETMGSVQHARQVRASGRKVEVMVSLEMIGYFSDQPQSQSFPFPLLGFVYPSRGDFIAIVGRVQDWSATRKVKAGMLGASDLPVCSINASSLVPGIDFSDHSSYWDQGFPALMITDTAFYRNPNYHQAGDVARTLDYGRMAKVVQGVFGVIQSYAPAH
jgi:Zn-dependent M28 family amino/carboxypeptidase